MVYAVVDKGLGRIFEDVIEFMNFIYIRKNRRKVLKDNIKFKKLDNKELAKEWLKKFNGKNLTKVKKSNEKTLYFDAGTGRGVTESRVTGMKGQSLVKYAKLKNIKINKYGNVEFPGKTNNYGELASFYIALKIALKYDYKKIAGDSELVIKWWSVGNYKKNKLSEETVKLIEKTIELRKIFEKKGGVIHWISGDINPADLGFHKKTKK